MNRLAFFFFEVIFIKQIDESGFGNCTAKISLQNAKPVILVPHIVSLMDVFNNTKCV